MTSAIDTLRAAEALRESLPRLREMIDLAEKAARNVAAPWRERAEFNMAAGHLVRARWAIGAALPARDARVKGEG